jgi:hypothetical protein
MTTWAAISTGQWALMVLMLFSQLQVTLQQQCGVTDVRGRGAISDDDKDDSQAFLDVEKDDLAGVIYVPRGKYVIHRTLILAKPLVAEAGAVLVVRCTYRLAIPFHTYLSTYLSAQDNCPGSVVPVVLACEIYDLRFQVPSLLSSTLPFPPGR